MKYRIACWPAAKRPLGTFLAGILAFLGSPTGLRAQQPAPGNPAVNINYLNNRSFPNIFEPYTTPSVPPLQMANSPRLDSLIQNGKLRLSLQDAIALALENNLDIAVARYQLPIAQTDLLRAKSGGATRGVSGAFQSSALFGGALGGGVGSSTAGGGGGGGGVTGGGGAVDTGSVGSFDPIVGFNFGEDQRATPLNFTSVSGSNVVKTHDTTYSAFYVQRFVTGTSFTMALSGSRESSTSPTPQFNPVLNANWTLGFNQPLLRGFGRRANAQFIRIAKNDLTISDSVFRQQVITTVTQVLNLYYDLLAFRQNVRVARQALAYAEKLLADNKRQVEIGTLAPIEVVRAESEVAARQQDLVVAGTRYLQQQELLKTALSKRVTPELANVELEPTDDLPEPHPGDVPPLDESLRLAHKSRPEIEQAELNLRNQDITIKSARNALLPTMNLFGTYRSPGLTGDRIVRDPATGAIIATESNEAGDVLSQVFRGKFPDYSFGLSVQIPLRNRSAAADAARALLEERQLQTRLQLQINQVEQDVRNAEIAVTQAKAQIEAARKATTLARETLDAEQKKFQLGESTVFLVIQAERDLVTAQGTETQARSTYAKALTQFGQAAGTTLARNHIELSEALSGKVNRNPNIPGTPDTPSAPPDPANPGGSF